MNCELVYGRFTVKEMERRVFQSMSENGLLEMSAGFYLLVLGVLFLEEPKLVAFSVFALFIIKPVVTKIQNRYIHPRIGYVKLRENDSSVGKGIALGSAFFIVILVGSLIALNITLGSDQGRTIWFRWFLPILASVMFAFGPYWLGSTYGLKRGYFMAFFIPAIGIIIALLGKTTGYTSLGIVFLTAALPSIISGVIMFNRFLSQNPVGEVSDEA